LRFGDKSGRDTQIAPEPLDRTGYTVQKAGRLDLQRSYALHFFSKVCDLIVEDLLQALQIPARSGRAIRALLSSPQEIDLHFHPDERLKNAVVKFLRQAQSLPGLSPRPQAPYQEFVEDDGADFPD
jgi:hypothetical protein